VLLLSAFAALLALQSCSDGAGGGDANDGGGEPTPGRDDDESGGDPADGDSDGQPAEGAQVQGRVRSVGGSAIPGAVVRVGEKQTATDADGLFTLDSLEPGADLVLVASRPGWSRQFVPLELASGASRRLEIVLAETRSLSIDASALPQTLWFADSGLEIQFVSGQFEDSAGSPAFGPVDVASTLLAEPAAILAAPGGMTGLLDDGGTTPLQSFGMAGVFLSRFGEPFRFTGEAVVSWPLPSGSPFSEGDRVPLWGLDESLGLWTQEGEGSAQGGRFVANVPHFSWWNADLPADQNGCVHGVLRTSQGEPAPGIPILAYGLSYLGVSTADSAADGSFCVPLQRGGTAQIMATGGSGADLLQWSGPAEAATEPAACGSPSCVDLGALTMTSLLADDDGDGFSEVQGDCDDGDPLVGPGLPDPAGDGVDSDCDGVDGVDADGDLWAAGPGPDWDCDDGDASVHPGAEECCDGRDEDCDGFVDSAASGPPLDAVWYYADGDGDGWGDPLSGAFSCSSADSAGSLEAGDCDDADPAVFPGAPESCDGVDRDCDGEVDEPGSLGSGLWFADSDGDGFGNPASPLLACTQPASSAVPAGDCDDADAAVFPGAIETCDGRDEDCDGLADEWPLPSAPPAYLDLDGDGWGGDALVIAACVPPPGFSALAGDCDDGPGGASVHPGAAEDCESGVDANCDGSVGWADADGDGAPACVDCDDADPTRRPGAPEGCDSVDSDCDGDLADFWADTDGDGIPDCLDEDDDGDGSPDLVDCEPLVSTAFSGAPRVCNGLDNDCDGEIDPCGLLGAPLIVQGAGIAYLLGSALAAGDLGGDGLPELVIGSPGASEAAPNAGAAHVIPAEAEGLVLAGSASAALFGELLEDHAGSALAVCQLDSDAPLELAVGAWAGDWAGQVSGTVYFVDGEPSGVASLGDLPDRRDGESAGDRAGSALACGGDLSGDGIGDLLVGAWLSDRGAPDSGAVFVVAGPVSGLGSLSSAAAVVAGAAPFDEAGRAVAAAGDVDGDGWNDVLVGAPGHGAEGPDAGAAFLVHGPLSGQVDLPGAAAAVILGEGSGDRLGDSLAGAGDLDGDGFDDIVVAASSEALGSLDGAGAAYVFLGPVAGELAASDADAVLRGDQAGEGFGSTLLAPGDLDGDGLGDLLVGSPGADGDAVDSGRVLLFLGPFAGELSPADAAAVWYGPSPGAWAGASLAVLDRDGDGALELAVGAPFEDSSFGAAGSVYVVPLSDALP
jgi:hypothetical protein